MSDEQRNKATNILLLCSPHHTVVDRNPQVYSVQVLRQMKADHEAKIAKATRLPQTKAPTAKTKESLHSTLLHVSQLPRYVYSAETDYTEKQKDEVKKEIDYMSISREEFVPFILRENRLFAFQDLRAYENPFAKVANPVGAIRIPVRDLCTEAEGKRRFVSLLNSAIAKHCGRKRVFFDREHHRFYFVPTEAETERVEPYRTLTGRNESRNVVWNPKTRKTGEGKRHWLHLAADLSFHQLAAEQWCFTIRPERHVTKDGVTPYNSKFVGRKVTKLKARMFNDGYLSEVHFWRDFLSGGKPRFILNFGAQFAIVETQLLSLDVEWEGIPADAKAFTNQVFDEDLFTFGELQQASSGQDDEEEETDEEDSDDEAD